MGGRDRGGVMGGILKDPGIRTEAWSERKVSGSRGELCGDKSHTTEWWGKNERVGKWGPGRVRKQQQPENESVKTSARKASGKRERKKVKTK